MAAQTAEQGYIRPVSARLEPDHASQEHEAPVDGPGGHHSGGSRVGSRASAPAIKLGSLIPAAACCGIRRVGTVLTAYAARAPALA